jgi:predicted MFS family arabinose efflux permease
MISKIFNFKTFILGLLLILTGSILKILNFSNDNLSLLFLIVGFVLFIGNTIINYGYDNTSKLSKIVTFYFAISMLISLIMFFMALSNNDNSMSRVYIVYFMVCTFVICLLKFNRKLQSI